MRTTLLLSSVLLFNCGGPLDDSQPEAAAQARSDGLTLKRAQNPHGPGRLDLDPGAVRTLRNCSEPALFEELTVSVSLASGNVLLGRGKVGSRQSTLLVVPTPTGSMDIQIVSSTVVIGDPQPGDEIRAQGQFTVDGRVQASQIEVLCAQEVEVRGANPFADSAPLVETQQAWAQPRN